MDVGGVGHAEDVLQEAATAEQQVLTLPPAQQPLSVWDRGVVEVLAEVLGRRLESWLWMILNRHESLMRPLIIAWNS